MTRGTPIAIAVAAMALLTACAGAGTPAAITPVPLESAWRPGLMVEGYGPSGLGPSVTASATASASASTSDPAITDPTQRTLASVGLAEGDVASDFRVVPGANGTVLTQASWTYCDGSYPSESAREARRRMVVTTAAGASTGIATEVVLYTAEADAVQAMSELRSAAAACPSPRSVADGATTLHFTTVPSTDVDVTGLAPASDRLLVSTTVDSGQGLPYRLTRVWQRRGRVVAAVYYSGSGIAPGAATFTAADLANVHGLAATTASRLDALDVALVTSS